MLRLALKSVRHNPKRLILTALAVALGVALVSATMTFTSAFSRGFTELFGDIAAAVDVVVEPDSGDDEEAAPDDFAAPSEGMFDAEDLAQVQAVDGVAFAAGGVAYESGSLLDSEGELFRPGPPTLVYNYSGNADIDRSTLLEGSAPTADGEAVIDIDTYEDLELMPGDTVAIATGDGIQELTIVGAIRFGENNDLQTAKLLYTTESTVRELAGGYEGYGQIEIVAEDGADLDAIVDDINDFLPEGARAITSQDRLAEQLEQFDQILSYVDIFALVFGLVALFVGAYIIINTFRIIVTQRTREFGLLRAIGAQGAQLRSSILIEAVVVAIIAATFGILIGWGLAAAFGAIAELFLGNLLGALYPPLRAILWSYGLGVAITVIAALMPAIHASRISPMEALREAGTAGKKSLALRNVVGSAMLALGIGGVLTGLYLTVPEPLYWVGVGAVLIVLGTTLLAAQVLVPMAFGLRGVLMSLWGVNGKLAANNIRREPRRSANTAAALMIGVMLLALVATFTESLKDTFNSQLGGSNTDGIVIAQAGAIPQGAVDVMDDVDGVDLIARYGFGQVLSDGEVYSLGIYDAEEIDQIVDIPADRPLAEADGGVFIDPSLQDTLEVGDEVTLEGTSGTLTLPVTGTLDEINDPFSVDWEQGSQLIDDIQIFQVLLTFEPGTDADAVIEELNDRLGEEFPTVIVQSPGDLTQFFNAALDQMLVVISGLLGAALVIAILGVANTLLLSVTERTREIGLLRAVGVTRGSVWGMVTLEAVVMAVFGTILGIILGVGLGSALVDSLGEFGFERVVIPWVAIGIYTVLSMIAGVVAAIWPAHRASRMDILKAIAADG